MVVGNLPEHDSNWDNEDFKETASMSMHHKFLVQTDGRPASIVDGGLRNIVDGVNDDCARELQLCWLSHAPAAWLASAMRACTSKTGLSAQSTRSSEHGGV